MSFQASFAQILREKMNQSANPGAAPEATAFNSDPAGMAYLLGQINRFEFQTRRGQYPRPAIRPQPVRSAHVFSESQKAAFEFFKIYIQDLSAGFTATELKKAFRRAALILHPDRGGQTEQFLALKAHYQTLHGLVATV